MLILMGIAFTIACITQLQNALTRKWHFEINWERCRTKYERWLLLVTGHLGFIGRAGIFLFVGVLMFKALRRPVRQSGDYIADGLNQLLNTDIGTIFMMIVGLLTTIYGFFAVLCCYYRDFPTPVPVPPEHQHEEVELDEEMGQGRGRVGEDGGDGRPNGISVTS